ncbi:MAG: S26 family signal peptidase, partial [Gemmatimonadota bacterium]|nr:S26 family signal peptidase [Gemmatimonadota bacterium]
MTLVPDIEKRRTDALKRANRRPSETLPMLGRWARVVIFSLALFVVIRAFGIEAFKIASGSMEHTLFEGD